MSRRQSEASILSVGKIFHPGWEIPVGFWGWRSLEKGHILPTPSILGLSLAQLVRECINGGTGVWILGWKICLEKEERLLPSSVHSPEIMTAVLGVAKSGLTKQHSLSGPSESRYTESVIYSKIHSPVKFRISD